MTDKTKEAIYIAVMFLAVFVLSILIAPTIPIGQ